MAESKLPPFTLIKPPMHIVIDQNASHANCYRPLVTRSSVTRSRLRVTVASLGICKDCHIPRLGLTTLACGCSSTVPSAFRLSWGQQGCASDIDAHSRCIGGMHDAVCTPAVSRSSAPRLRDVDMKASSLPLRDGCPRSSSNRGIGCTLIPFSEAHRPYMDRSFELAALRCSFSVTVDELTIRRRRGSETRQQRGMRRLYFNEHRPDLG